MSRVLSLPYVTHQRRTSRTKNPLITCLVTRKHEKQHGFTMASKVTMLHKRTKRKCRYSQLFTPKNYFQYRYMAGKVTEDRKIVKKMKWLSGPKSCCRHAHACPCPRNNNQSSTWRENRNGGGLYILWSSILSNSIQCEGRFNIAFWPPQTVMKKVHTYHGVTVQHVLIDDATKSHLSVLAMESLDDCCLPWTWVTSPTTGVVRKAFTGEHSHRMRFTVLFCRALLRCFVREVLRWCET